MTFSHIFPFCKLQLPLSQVQVYLDLVCLFSFMPSPFLCAPCALALILKAKITFRDAIHGVMDPTQVFNVLDGHTSSHVSRPGSSYHQLQCDRLREIS